MKIALGAFAILLLIACTSTSIATQINEILVEVVGIFVVVYVKKRFFRDSWVE